MAQENFKYMFFVPVVTKVLYKSCWYNGIIKVYNIIKNHGSATKIRVQIA